MSNDDDVTHFMLMCATPKMICEVCTYFGLAKIERFRLFIKYMKIIEIIIVSGFACSNDVCMYKMPPHEHCNKSLFLYVHCKLFLCSDYCAKIPPRAPHRILPCRRAVTSWFRTTSPIYLTTNTVFATPRNNNRKPPTPDCAPRGPLEALDSKCGLGARLLVAAYGVLNDVLLSSFQVFPARASSMSSQLFFVILLHIFLMFFLCTSL